MRTYGPPPRKDGTWSLADGSIIHALQIVSKEEDGNLQKKSPCKASMSGKGDRAVYFF